MQTPSGLLGRGSVRSGTGSGDPGKPIRRANVGAWPGAASDGESSGGQLILS